MLRVNRQDIGDTLLEDNRQGLREVSHDSLAFGGRSISKGCARVGRDAASSTSHATPIGGPVGHHNLSDVETQPAMVLHVVEAIRGAGAAWFARTVSSTQAPSQHSVARDAHADSEDSRSAGPSA